MKKSRLGIPGKVRKLRESLGGRKAVVRAMKSASKTSLRRWEKQECEPLRAHIRLVNETYEIARRMGMLKKQRDEKKKRRK